MPHNEKDIVSYSRLDVVRDSQNRLHVIKYRRPGDQLLIFNDNLSYYNNAGYRPDGSVFAYEVLVHGKRNIPFCPECMSIHYPFEKKGRQFPGKIEALPLLTDYLSYVDQEEFSEEFMTYERFLKDFDTAANEQ